jgi:hypothetical protein
VRLPGWRTGWDVRAIEFARRSHSAVFPVRTEFSTSPAAWGGDIRSVNELVDYLFTDAQQFGFDPGRVSIFLAAPWWAAWALGVPFGHHTNLLVHETRRPPRSAVVDGVDVYDQYSDHSLGFFISGRLRRDMKVEVVGRTLIKTRVEEVGQAAGQGTRAIVLKLGSHDLVPQAKTFAEQEGASRVLIVEETYDTPGYLDQSTANFERLSTEVFSAIKAFIDHEREYSGERKLSFLVYASMPVSTAFLLGAHLSVGTHFRLMHWDDRNDQYIEVKVR